MIRLKRLTKYYDEKQIFLDNDICIYDGEKVGIIGNNGCGKTTLLNIIAGIDNDYSGSRDVNGSIAYLSQNSFCNFNTLNDAILNNSKNLFMWLKKLNFTGDVNQVENLSCGEKTKLAFALAFISNPQILLLDEPTNHIDYVGRQIIEKIINNFEGTVVLVSHDIDFLNKSVNKVIKLFNGEVFEYMGNYDSYLVEYKKEQHNKIKEYEKHKKRVADIERNITEIKEYARIAERDVGRQDNGNGSGYMQTKTAAMKHAKKMNKQVANRVSKLEKQLTKIPEKPDKLSEIKYSFNENPLKSKFVVKISDMNFSFENKKIFNEVNFEILSGEKIGVVGENGVGKSTLINLICNNLICQSGKIYIPSSVKVARLEQDIYDLDEEKTIYDLSSTHNSEYKRIFLTNLVNMNIDKTRFNTKIKYLSFGERMRIKLNFIILSDANFIILDEPTNHLDIENKEFMIKALQGYKGTILIVSHDTNFIKNICNKVYQIENKKINEIDNRFF